MDDLSDVYFESIFENLLRESLSSRYKRHNLVEHFKKTIKKSSENNRRTDEEGCRKIVTAIIRCHQKTLRKNGFVCYLGKYHNVLYLAVKLCFDFRLSDTDLVCQLLKEIYRCEDTFERILAGAIYGVTVTHFLVGWKSDFQDQEENISAVAYFLEESSKRNLMFEVKTGSGVEMKKLVDVPISPGSDMTPLVAALKMFNAEIVLLLLRFDASFPIPFFEIYPPEEVISDREMQCVNILLRAMPSINKRQNIGARCLSDVSFSLSSVPSTLKQLCRCEIRNLLRLNSMLPLGIHCLGLPKSVADFVDLLSD